MTSLNCEVSRSTYQTYSVIIQRHGLVPGYVGIVTSDAHSGFHGLEISVKTLVDSPCIRSSAGFSVFAAVHVNEREKEWGIVCIAF